MKLFTFEPVYDNGDPTGGTEAPPSTETTPPQPTVSWEERYKGLQAASEKQRVKLEKEAREAKDKLDQTLADLEAARASGTTASQTTDKLSKDLEALQTQVSALTAEKTALAAKITRQNIVITEFPELAQLSEYIPDAPTDEQFRANAQKFAQTLEGHVKSKVDGLVNTSTSAPPSHKAPPSATEIDRAWDEVYSTAGVPGKEAEYQKAYAKLQGLLKPQ